MKNLLLIDCNAMLNVYYYGSIPVELRKDDDPKYYGMIPHNKYGIYNNAIIPFMNMLQTAIKALKVTHLACAFDMGSKTLRKQNSETYKANRKGCPFPLKEQIEVLKASLRNMGVSCYISDLYEADDIIGTISSECCKKMDNIYIITTDHDYFQLVKENVIVCGYVKGKEYEDMFKKYPEHNIFGKFFRYDKRLVKETTGVFPVQITDYKGFAGDASDNIQGVPSVGKTYAVKILENYRHGEDVFGNLSKIPEDMHKMLGKAYNALIQEGAKDAFYESKKLATIITDVPVGNIGDSLKIHVNTREIKNFKNFIR